MSKIRKPIAQATVSMVAAECVLPAGSVGAAMRAGGGGRRSDVRLKHNVALLGHLDDGLGFYRFSYHGNSKLYVGVMAQEVQQLMPQAVARGPDGLSEGEL